MLTLTREQAAAIYAHLDAQKPLEGCGLLAGRDGRVERVYAVTNVAKSPVRYEMEPNELVAAMVEMESDGLELLAIFHSHPAGPPFPSRTDIVEAYYPDSAYIICSPDAGGRWQARAFEVRDGQSREIALNVSG